MWIAIAAVLAVSCPLSLAVYVAAAARALLAGHGEETVPWPGATAAGLAQQPPGSCDTRRFGSDPRPAARPHGTARVSSCSARLSPGIQLGCSAPKENSEHHGTFDYLSWQRRRNKKQGPEVRARHAPL